MSEAAQAMQLLADEVANPKDIAAQRAAKLRWELLPVPFIEDVIRALMHGADKYGAWNWRSQPVRMTVYFAACCRHLTAWLCGQDRDPESGLPHLAHAAATLCVVSDAIWAKAVIDDRPYQCDSTSKSPTPNGDT